MGKLKFVAAVAAISLLGFGCKDSSGPEDAGFTATISGDMDRSVSGEAIFGVSSEGGVDRWMIFMVDGVFLGLDFDMIGFSREASRTPIPVGTHTISTATSNTLDDEDITAAYMTSLDHGASFGVFTSVSGTLTIASANSDRVTGSFAFTSTRQLGYGDSIVGVEDLSMSGTFIAEAGNIPSGTGT